MTGEKPGGLGREAQAPRSQGQGAGGRGGRGAGGTGDSGAGSTGVEAQVAQGSAHEHEAPAVPRGGGAEGGARLGTRGEASVGLW